MTTAEPVTWCGFSEAEVTGIEAQLPTEPAAKGPVDPFNTKTPAPSLPISMSCPVVGAGLRLQLDINRPKKSIEGVFDSLLATSVSTLVANTPTAKDCVFVQAGHAASIDSVSASAE